jgi:hypothetical protein
MMDGSFNLKLDEETFNRVLMAGFKSEYLRFKNMPQELDVIAVRNALEVLMFWYYPEQEARAIVNGEEDEDMNDVEYEKSVHNFIREASNSVLNTAHLDYLEDIEYPNIDALKSILRDNVLKVNFTKKDGSFRSMICTLRADLLPDTIASANARNTSTTSVPVWDLEAQGWRSFNFASIDSIYIVNGRG